MWLSSRLPFVERITGNSAGAMNDDGSRKLTLHSTEGSSIDGAVGAYRANNSWPTLTIDCPRRHAVEHLDLLVAARSLRNASGGVDETNRDGTVHIQIELVGFAGTPTTLGSPEDLIWLGAEILRPIHELTGVPLATTLEWLSYPDSYGANGVRLSGSAWDAYSGVLAHMHVPENDHGDTGSIDIAWILRAANDTHTPSPEEDDGMTLVRNKKTGHCFVQCGSKLINVTGESNVQSARNGGMPVWEAEPDEYDRIVRHCGPVLT